MFLIKHTVDGIMREIGNLGHHVMLRFDPERESKNFTIVIDGKRITDTDCPHYEFIVWWRDNIGDESK